MNNTLISGILAERLRRTSRIFYGSVKPQPSLHQSICHGTPQMASHSMGFDHNGHSFSLLSSLHCADSYLQNYHHDE